MSDSRAAPLRAVDGILLLDKPLGLSSNDALQRVRRLFRAAKAGHTGSLDPLASGLLPICFGEATKLSGLLLDGAKHYRASVRLGASTTTGDAEGEVVEQSDPTGVGEAAVRAALAALTGPIMQLPPMYSALKRDGRRLYELAREGIELDRQPRPVIIHRLELLSLAPGCIEIEVWCSKGTYIRSLGEDLAKALNQRGHLASLRRIGAEPFEGGMVDIATLEAAAALGPAALDAYLLPPAAAVAHRPSFIADPAQARILAQGCRLQVRTGLAAGPVAVLDRAGKLLGLARATADGALEPQRWLRASLPNL